MCTHERVPPKRGAATRRSFFRPRRRVWDGMGNRVRWRVWRIATYRDGSCNALRCEKTVSWPRRELQGFSTELRGGEGTIVTVASNRSTGNCLSNFKKHELINLSSMRVSSRILPPSEVRIVERRCRGLGAGSSEVIGGSHRGGSRVAAVGFGGFTGFDIASVAPFGSVRRHALRKLLQACLRLKLRSRMSASGPSFWATPSCPANARV